MNHTIKFGIYKGKTFEQLALIDYPYLVLASENVNRLYQFKEHLNEIIHSLNNFVPQIRCSMTKCQNTAEYMSIALIYDYKPTPIDISVSKRFVCCDEEDCKSTMLTYEKSRLYPIRFGTLLKFPHLPRFIREDIRRVLLQAARFEVRLTSDNAAKFFENLEARVKEPVQTLMKI